MSNVDNVIQVITSSPAINTLYEILRTGNEIRRLKERKEKISHRKTQYAINFSEAKDYLIYTHADSKADSKAGYAVQIHVPKTTMAKLFKKNNKALITLRKTLIFMASQIGSTSYKGNLKKAQIIFSTREIVELGISKSLNKAPVVIQNALETLQQILFAGTSKFRGKTISIKKPVSIIEGFQYRNGIFTVELNPLIDWDFFVQGFYVMPKAYYSLNGKACDLLNYIFFLARQRLEGIKRKENELTFTVSYEALQFCLNLPDIEKAGEHRHIQRLCVQPINEAIDEIDSAIGEELKAVSPELRNEDFIFLNFPFYRENQKPKKPQELPNTKLEVTLGKAFSEYFIELNTQNKERLKRTRKRKSKENT